MSDSKSHSVSSPFPQAFQRVADPNSFKFSQQQGDLHDVFSVLLLVAAQKRVFGDGRNGA